MKDSGSLLATVYSELGRAQIAYALLRDDVQQRAAEDFDILVWPEDRDLFIRLVARLGFVMERKRISRKDVFWGWDAGKILILDVHYALIQGGLIYMELPERGSVISETPPRMFPGDELAHLVLHELLGKGGITDKRIGRIRSLREEGAGEAVFARISDPRILTEVRKVVADPEAYPPGSDCANDSVSRIRRILLRRPSNRWNRTKNKLLRRLRRPRGLQVAFMGVDGAGKSTTLTMVTQSLEETGRVPVATTYMGPWGHFRTRPLNAAHRLGLTPPAENWLKLAIDRLRGDLSSPPLLKCLAKWIKGRVRGWSYYVAVYLDLVYRYLKDVHPAIVRGKVVLSDRYIYDLKYLHRNRPTASFPFMRRLITCLFPRPHLIFFLHAPPESITARSSQLTTAEISSLQELYRKALAGLTVVEVSSDKPVNAVADEITGRIIRAYFRRR